MGDSTVKNGRSVAPTEIEWKEFHNFSPSRYLSVSAESHKNATIADDNQGDSESSKNRLDKNKLLVMGAGLFAGVTGVLLHPISVVKTRLQVASHGAIERYGFSVIKGLLKRKGIHNHGLCKGFGSGVRGTIAARILFLFALERTEVSAFKMVEPLRSSEPTQATLWFRRMVVVPLQPHCCVCTNGVEKLFSHKISGVLPMGGLTETIKTWLAPVPLSFHFRYYSKKSRANGRKATSRPKSQREQARRGSITCFHCTRTFVSPKANALHYKRYHKDILSKKPLFDCTCGNFFNNKDDYEDHDCPHPPGQTAKESDKILIKKMTEQKKENEQIKKQKGGKKKKK